MDRKKWFDEEKPELKNLARLSLYTTVPDLVGHLIDGYTVAGHSVVIQHLDHLRVGIAYIKWTVAHAIINQSQKLSSTGHFCLLLRISLQQHLLHPKMRQSDIIGGWE